MTANTRARNFEIIKELSVKLPAASGCGGDVFPDFPLVIHSQRANKHVSGCSGAHSRFEKRPYIETAARASRRWPCSAHEPAVSRQQQNCRSAKPFKTKLNETSCCGRSCIDNFKHDRLSLRSGVGRSSRDSDRDRVTARECDLRGNGAGRARFLRCDHADRPPRQHRHGRRLVAALLS